MRKKFIELFIVIGILSFISNFLFGKSICLFYNTIGIPCFTCGMTRAYMRLLHLDIGGAFTYHPLFFMVPVILFIKEKKGLYIVFGIFLVVWLLRMYLYFPNVEPMVFNDKALYIRILRFLKETLLT